MAKACADRDRHRNVFKATGRASDDGPIDTPFIVTLYTTLTSVSRKPHMPQEEAMWGFHLIPYSETIRLFGTSNGLGPSRSRGKFYLKLSISATVGRN